MCSTIILIWVEHTGEYHTEIIIKKLFKYVKKEKSAYEPSGPSDQNLSRFFCPGFSPLNGMLVHRRVTPPALNSPVPMYTFGQREAL